MKIRGLAHQWFGSSMALLLCWLLLLTRARAATVLSGNVSGTWTTDQSPYILIADCTVPNGQTLSIQPGLTVVIGPDVTLRVNGGITAIGTPEVPIVIRGASASNYWKSIQMNYSGFTNRYHYCRVSEGSHALWLLVSGSNSVMTAELLNCDFSNCRDSAILGQAWGYPPSGPPGNPTGSATLTPEIHDCVFDNTGVGCYFTAGYITPNFSSAPGDAYVNPRITGNIFKNLPTDSSVAGDALRLDVSFNNSPSTNLSRPFFINNTVVNSYGGVSARAPNFEQ